MDNDTPNQRRFRNTRRIGLFAGAIVGFSAIYFLALSLGFVGDGTLSAGILGAAAGGTGGRIGARWGVRGAVLGIVVASLGAAAGTYFWFLTTVSGA